MYTVNFPCKPGDDYWWVDEETMEIHHEKGGIKGVAIYPDNLIKIIEVDGMQSIPGTCWCCLSLEEAEAMREEMMK